jgi:hypothetical protein
MSYIRLTANAVKALCVPTGFPMLKGEIVSELRSEGYDSTILFIDQGFIHIQFMSDEQAVMFRLKYSDVLI